MSAAWWPGSRPTPSSPKWACRRLKSGACAKPAWAGRTTPPPIEPSGLQNAKGRRIAPAFHFVRRDGRSGAVVDPHEDIAVRIAGQRHHILGIPALGFEPGVERGIGGD